MGTLPYLKNKYGTGYTIDIIRKDSNVEKYRSEITKFFPNCTPIYDQSDMYDSFKIATGDFLFSKAFAFLVELKGNNTISDFSIVNTTLEQVFLGFSRMQINQEGN